MSGSGWSVSLECQNKERRGRNDRLLDPKVLMKKIERAAAGLAMISMLAGAAGAEPSKSLESMGLDSGFLRKSLVEFKDFGFAMGVAFIDLEAAKNASYAHLGAGRNNAIFSLVEGFGPSARCVVALKPSLQSSAPESDLVHAAVVSGADRREAWRVALRHELGHCALGSISDSPLEPDPLVAEPFADVFSLEWSAQRGGPVAAKTIEAFEQARTRVGFGPHKTGNAIARWKSERASLKQGASAYASPCAAAWIIAPLDARPPSQACPR